MSEIFEASTSKPCSIFLRCFCHHSFMSKCHSFSSKNIKRKRNDEKSQLENNKHFSVAKALFVRVENEDHQCASASVTVNYLVVVK